MVSLRGLNKTCMLITSPGTWHILRYIHSRQSLLVGLRDGCLVSEAPLLCKVSGRAKQQNSQHQITLFLQSQHSVSSRLSVIMWFFSEEAEKGQLRILAMLYYPWAHRGMGGVRDLCYSVYIFFLNRTLLILGSLEATSTNCAFSNCVEYTALAWDLG